MGLINWINRKTELKKIENDAKAEAMKSYYQSEEYKKDIIDSHKQNLKEGKSSEFGSWLKRVSTNAANSFSNETVKLDKEKLFGKK